jgi:hypothetical protein
VDLRFKAGDLGGFLAIEDASQRRSHAQDAISLCCETRAVAPKVPRPYFRCMFVTCAQCFRRAQIPLPPIGARLRCTGCGERQVFGTRPRRRREISGVTRFSARAPALVPDQAPLNDAIDDLFIKAG